MSSTAPIPSNSHRSFFEQPLVWSVIVLLSIAAVAAYMSRDAMNTHTWYQCHEGARYHVIGQHFYDAWAHGLWYPRWLPDFNGGYGYPTFVFCQPGFYFLLSPIVWLTGSVPLSISILILLLIVQGGTGAYLLASCFVDRGTALFAAIMFIITPYVYINLYVRGDLSEMAAMLLTPWPTWSFYRLSSQIGTGSRRILIWTVVRSSLLLFLVFICHPAVSLFFLPSLVLWLTVAAWKVVADKVQYALCCAGGITMAIAASSLYWLPAITMKQHVDYESAISGYFTAADHTLWPGQLFSFFWGYGLSVPGPEDGMPFSLGLPHFLIATTGALLCIRKRAITGALGIYLALIFLMLHYCNWLWAHIPLLAFVQFPWRILSVIALFQMLCIAGTAPVISKPNLVVKLLPLIYVALTIIAHSNMRASTISCNLPATLNLYAQNMLSIPGFTANESDQIKPKTQKTELIKAGRDNRPMVDDPNFRVSFLPGNSKYHINCFVQKSGDSPLLRLNQVYFPGWRVLIDGKEVKDDALRKSCEPEGLLKVPMPADAQAHSVEAWYDGPPHWRTYAIYAIAAILGIPALLAIAPFKRIPNPDSSPAISSIPAATLHFPAAEEKGTTPGQC
jgi:hypothetical protein